MIRGLLTFALVTVFVAHASAEPPSGFAQFGWGTKPGVLRQELLTQRCMSVTESNAPDGWRALLCQGYSLEDVSVLSVRFDFEPADSLAGYAMYIARGSYPRFRDIVLQRFGPPTSRRGILWQGTVLSWSSDTVTATLVEKCGQDTSCMEVTTPALERKREALIERKRQDAIQGF